MSKDIKFMWVNPNGKVHLQLVCVCGELMEKDIDLREHTVILCSKCKKPIFRGGSEK